MATSLDDKVSLENYLNIKMIWFGLYMIEAGIKWKVDKQQKFHT